MSENKVIIFNGACQHSFSAQKDCLVTLNAGKNVVSVSKLNRLLGKTGDDSVDKMKSQSFIDMIEDGTIEIVDDSAVEVAETKTDDNDNSGTKNPNDDDIKINIVELGAKEAISVINAEVDVDTVQGYLDAENASAEPRKTVVKACDDAIIALLADPATGDDD